MLAALGTPFLRRRSRKLVYRCFSKTYSLSRTNQNSGLHFFPSFSFTEYQFGLDPALFTFLFFLAHIKKKSWSVFSLFSTWHWTMSRYFCFKIVQVRQPEKFLSQNDLRACFWTNVKPIFKKSSSSPPIVSHYGFSTPPCHRADSMEWGQQPKGRKKTCFTGLGACSTVSCPKMAMDAHNTKTNKTCFGASYSTEALAEKKKK